MSQISKCPFWDLLEEAAVQVEMVQILHSLEGPWRNLSYAAVSQVQSAELRQIWERGWQEPVQLIELQVELHGGWRDARGN